MLDETSDVRRRLAARRADGDGSVRSGPVPIGPDGRIPRHGDAGTTAGSCPTCGEGRGDRDEVADVVGELQRLVLDQSDLSDLASTVLEPCVRAFGRDAELGLSLRWTDDRGRHVVVTEGTTRRAQELVAWQDRHEDGPLRTASEQGVTCVVAGCDGAADRFPAYREASAGRGLGSAAAFPLLVGDLPRGALGVMYPTADPVCPTRIRAGEELARVVSSTAWNLVAYRELGQLAQHLTVALEGRATIERAKGVLMGELGLDEDTAFDLLATQSQHENVKLREVARQLLEARRRV